MRLHFQLSSLGDFAIKVISKVKLLEQSMDKQKIVERIIDEKNTWSIW